MDDAELVLAAIEGDSDAYAAIYDRYADQIYDFCGSILRNRADASDAVEETFLVAFEALDELAAPGRLRPWLFAIAHRSILERIRANPGGADDTDMDWTSGPSAERLSRAELAEFVWQASAGLETRDRVLLDLHLRQGLEGRDLASAAGVNASQLDRRLDRLEAQQDRSLGALLVARTGRRSCPDMFAVLDGWDGRLTPEFRARVNAHVDDCEVCNSRRRILPGPLALLASTPLAPAPSFLRRAVLAKAGPEAAARRGEVEVGPLVASADWAFNQEGFPDLTVGERRRPEPLTGPVIPITQPTNVIPVAPPAPTVGNETRIARTTPGTSGPGPARPGSPGRTGQGQPTNPGTAGPTRTGPAADNPDWAGDRETGSAYGGETVVGRTIPSDTGRSASSTRGAGLGGTGAAMGGPFPDPSPATAQTAYLPPVEPPETPPRRHDRWGMLIGALAGVIILIAGAVYVLSSGKTTTGTVGLTTVPSTIPVTTVSTIPTTSTLAPLSVPSTIATTTTVATVGKLVVSTAGGSDTLMLGVTSSTTSLTVGNSGPAPLDFTATPTGAGLTVNPGSGTLAPGTTQVLTVALDRSQSPDGKYSGSVLITSLGGSTTVMVSAMVDPGPTISNETAALSTLYVSGCTKKTEMTTMTTVSASVTGPQPLTEVVLHWQDASGAGGTSAMTTSGANYIGALGPFTTMGTAMWWVTSIDEAGATATSPNQPLTVKPC